ncbi:MAG TPA: hypothetical protein VEY91_11790 [Candidatus Limnocylindria bacterium]|nr:hypothetical protein [Candidatus Limnocylindria bacterium]
MIPNPMITCAVCGHQMPRSSARSYLTCTCGVPIVCKTLDPEPENHLWMQATLVTSIALALSIAIFTVLRLFH